MRRSVLLGCVQETALIPLYARVLESRRKRPILEDRKAIEMVEAIDWDFGRFGQRRRLVGCALRSAMFDGWWWRSAPIQIAASRPAFLAVRVQLLGGQLL